MATETELYFSRGFDRSTEHRLLEVPEKLMPAIFGGKPAVAAKRERENGSDDAAIAFIVKGDSELILTTAQRSFGLRRNEFSNNVYFVATGDGEMKTVVEKTNCAFEVHCVRPRLETVRAALLSSPPLGVGDIDAEPSLLPSGITGGPLHTFSQIVDSSLCARAEVAEFLIGEGAVILDGKVRWISDVAAHQLLMVILSTLRAHDRWTVDCFSFTELVAAAANGLFKEFAVSSVLSRVSKPHPDGLSHYLLPEATMIAIGRGMLAVKRQSEPHGIPLASFMVAWRSDIKSFGSLAWLEIPETQTSAVEAADKLEVTNDSLLGKLFGLATVCNETGAAETAKLLWMPEWTLPINPADRIIRLFKVKERWSAPELRAFIQPIVDEGQTFDGVVGKFCREIRSADKTVPSTYVRF